MIRVICVHLWLTLTVAAQAPEILKVDPPSWWTGSTVNPVRLMIHGRNLQDARVKVLGLRVVKINNTGTYIFADVFIPPNTQPAQRLLSVTTPRGTAQASFEVLP